MGYEITLDDKCRIFYSTMPVHLRSYHFEYTSFHNIKYERTYDILLAHIDHRTMFKVEGFMEEPKCFETFNEAEAFIFKEFADLRIKMMETEDEVKARLNKKGRRKKNGNI